MKLKLTVEDHASKQPPSVDGYGIIDLNCFMKSRMSATVCGTCKTHQMKITEEVVIASTFLLTCPCGATLYIFTSKKLSSDGTNSSRSAFELNRRLLFAFHTIGLGYSTAMQFFTVAMNMPFTMSKRTYQHHVISVRAAALTVAEKAWTKLQQTFMQQTKIQYLKCVMKLSAAMGPGRREAFLH